MALSYGWIFLCEDVEVGPSDEIISIKKIIRSQFGFGMRRLPLEVNPYFVLAMRGDPGEPGMLTVSVTDDMTPPVGRDWPFTLPQSGYAEIAVPVGTLILQSPRC